MARMPRVDEIVVKYNRGLGALEGPESTGIGLVRADPTFGLGGIEREQMLRRYGDVAGAEALANLGRSIQRGRNISATPAKDIDIFDPDARDLIRSYAEAALPTESDLVKRKRLAREAEDVAAKLEARPEELTGLEQLEAGMGIAAPKAAPSKQAPMQEMTPEQFRAEEAQRAEMAGMDTKQNPVDQAFVQAMREFNKAAGKEDDAAEMSEADLIEKYKQEFADATGIDISGKVDKSQALMAFGLALMQNRAGKGFNVGNMLRSVGEAGEKALPELKAAKSEAQAARIAAGKYALQRIESGRNAKAALALEQQKFAQQAYLKKMELDAKASEGPEIKNVSTIKPIAGLELRMGTANGRSVWAGGVPAANMLVRSYNSAQNALGTLNEIESSISEIANSPSPSFTLLADRFNTALTGLGLKDPNVAFGEDAVSPEQKAAALRDSLVQEFKRFLTQETGNGISNFDVQNMERLLGQMDILGNPQDAINRVNQVRGIFEGKVAGLNPFIEDLQDPDMYTSTQEYEKVQGIIDKNLGMAPGMKVEVSDGVPTVDLTKG